MVRARLRTCALLALVPLLGACMRIIPVAAAPALPPPAASPPLTQAAPPVTPSSVPPPATALLAGVAAGPAIASLGLRDDDAVGALAAFRESCPRLLARADASGLTRGADWGDACAAAERWPEAQAPRFFEAWFETARVGSGQSFVTGYYEPEIAGVRTRQPGFDVPIYAVPSDLIRAMPGDAAPLPDGRQPLGRYDANFAFRPYHTRAEIDDGALAGKGLEIAWAADELEFFFLQVQGSGRLRAPDGSVMRIGFAGVNGFPFTGPGAILRARGLLGSGPGQYPGSMQGIMRFVRENPVEGRDLLRANRSYVFFRELTDADGTAGPLGSLGVAVRRGDSVAADPAYVPLGAPVWLALDRPEASGLWVAQDTGGAIKGANRFDSFWGGGDDAARIAGGMTGRGSALLFLPRGTLARLGAQ